MAWTVNIAAKVRWQPMRSDIPPQKKRPTALNKLTTPNRGAISAGAKRVRSERMTTAFEMIVMPAITLAKSCSHRR